MILVPTGAVAIRTAPPLQSQAALNRAAGDDLKVATAEMTRLLDRLRARATGRPDALAKLAKAQAAWEAYRDAQIDAEWPAADRGQYGSAHPMCVTTVLTALTRARVAELQQMLTPEEGDVCASQWPE
jgi:uncharacterized protein YecT (DUF1311 family)